MFEELKTLVDVIYNSKKEYNDKIFLKYKIDDKFNSISFNQFIEMAEYFSASLYNIGIRKDSKIGIVSENHYKWLIADMGIILLGAVDVPRGSDSTAKELLYILNHSEVKYCLVENPTQLEKIISIKSKLPKLKYFILFSGKKEDINQKIPLGVKVLYFDDLLEKGKKIFNKYKVKLKLIREKIRENDLVTIIYTSGTTGTPKGVMLIHRNIMQNIRSLPDVIDITSKERWLSILPVWHVFERTIEYIIMATGGLMAYSKPTARHLLPDFAEIKPTFMVSVPRIWEALYQSIVNKVKKDSKLRWLIFNFFIKVGIYYSLAWKELKGLKPLFKKQFFLISIIKKIGAIFIVFLLAIFNFLGDKIVYSNIREKTGGYLRGPISGGGALPEYIDRFFSAIKMEILEGWGLTETAPVIGVRLFERLVPKTVGAPSPGIQILICDENGIPLKNQHEKGIVYIKGDNVMAGYYKDPEKTKDVITSSGWFNTGDLGRLTLKGELQLCGRAKDTIVLIGGENIEPQPIENKLLELSLIDQVIVVGQDKKVLGALIVPSEEALLEFADKNEISYRSFEDLCNNPQIIEEYRKRIKSKINEKNGFRDYERITFFKLIQNAFQPGVELTHSLKMKRDIIFNKYKSIIEKMFKKV